MAWFFDNAEETEFTLPVHIPNLLAYETPNTGPRLTVKYLAEFLVNLCRFLDKMMENTSGTCTTNGNPQFFLKCYIRQHMNSMELIGRRKISQNNFEVVMNQLKETVTESLSTPGDCVGALAAQALAEPLMQMTLNSVHQQHATKNSNPLVRLRSLLDATATDLRAKETEGLPQVR